MTSSFGFYRGKISKINAKLEKMTLSLNNPDLYEPKNFISSLVEFKKLVN